ncbi:MAG: hypothetical protein WCE47_05835 [Gaiella sp.]
MSNPAQTGRHGCNCDDERGDDMPVWAWVLLIIVVVLLLTGGIGYGRR